MSRGQVRWQCHLAGHCCGFPWGAVAREKTRALSVLGMKSHPRRCHPSFVTNLRCHGRHDQIRGDSIRKWDPDGKNGNFEPIGWPTHACQVRVRLGEFEMIECYDVDSNSIVESTEIAVMMIMKIDRELAHKSEGKLAVETGCG